MINYTTLRNRDFIQRCLATAERERTRGCNPSVRRIVALTVFGGAGGYYLSFDRATHIVYQYHLLDPEMRRPSIDERPSQVRALHITELAEKICAERHVSLLEATARALRSHHAPRFYFSVEYGIRLFNQYTKKSVAYVPLKQAV